VTDPAPAERSENGRFFILCMAHFSGIFQPSAVGAYKDGPEK
jgi:hypothetical protein